MLCISSILNARDDGMQHMRFCGSCGDMTAVLISHASIFLTVNRKKSTPVIKTTAIICTVLHLCNTLYIRYLNTEMFICDALHLGVGGGGEINCNKECEM